MRVLTVLRLYCLSHTQALDDCDRKLINQEMMSKYFKRIRQVMCEEHSCPACFRGFSTNDELESTLQRLDEDAQVGCRNTNTRTRIHAHVEVATHACSGVGGAALIGVVADC